MTQEQHDILQRLARLEATLEVTLDHMERQNASSQQDRRDMTVAQSALSTQIARLTERLDGLKSLPAQVRAGEQHDAAADAKDAARRQALDLSLRGIGLALAVPGTIGALVAVIVAFALSGDPAQ